MGCANLIFSCIISAWMSRQDSDIQISTVLSLLNAELFVRLCSSLDLHDIHVLLTASLWSQRIPFALLFDKYASLLQKFSVKCAGIYIMHSQSLGTNVGQDPCKIDIKQLSPC